MEIEKKIKFEEETLIKKCVLSSPYDPDRAEFCKELARDCRKEIDKLPTLTERDEVRNIVIGDVDIINRVSIGDKIKGKGFKVNRIIGDSRLFGITFEEKDYIEQTKRDRKQFAKCHLALYGLEKQFNEQINQGFFQTKENADALQQSERIILDEDASVVMDVTEKDAMAVWNKLNPDKRVEIFKQLEIAPSIMSEDFKSTLKGELELLNIREIVKKYPTYAREILAFLRTEKLSKTMGLNIPKKEMVVWKEREDILEFSICNDVINPKLEKDKYVVCSRANLENKQSFQILEKQTSKLFLAKGDWEKVKHISITEFWKGIGQGNREKILSLTKERVPSGVESFTDLDSASILSYNKTEQEQIRKTLLSEFTHQEIADMPTVDIEDVTLRELSVLDCWHNFLSMVQYPEAIKDKWLEIQMSLEVGEISEKKAIKLLKDLAKVEEMFQTKVVEGRQHGFENPTEYQPIRLRLFGSQHYINNLFNNLLVEFNFNTATNNNSAVQETIKKSISTIELKQLISNLILPDKQIKLYEQFEDISADSIWQTVYEIAESGMKDIFNDNAWDYITERNLDKNFVALYKEFGFDFDDIRDELDFIVIVNEEPYNEEYIDEKGRLKESFIKIGDGEQRDNEDDWEADSLYNYMETINKEYPDLSKDDVEFILMRDDALGYNFYTDIDYVAYIDINNLSKFIEIEIEDR